MKLHKIKYKLFFSYGIILFVLCLVMSTAYIIARQTIKTSVTESYQYSLKIIAQKLETQSHDISKLYELISSSSDANTYISRLKSTPDSYARHYNYNKFNSLLDSLVSSISFDSGEYQIIVCTDTGRTLYYSWKLAIPDQQRISADLQNLTLDSRRFSMQIADSYNPQKTSIPYLYYCRPLPNVYRSSTVTYVLIGVQLEHFRSLYEPLGVQGSAFYFLDSDGASVSGFTNVDLTNLDTIALTAPLPTIGWTVTQLVPTSQILSSLNKWSATVVIGLVVLVIVIALICAYIGNQISQPIALLYQDMQNVKQGNWNYEQRDFNHDEIGELSRKFYDMVDHIKFLNSRTIEDERQKRKLEIDALQAQINPHFMYNTMNSIKMLARFQRPDQVSSSLTALTMILKSTLGKTDETVTLEEEIETLRSYVYIQRIRYCNFSFIVECPQELEHTRMLRFILQPFVENSIFHGYEQVNEQTVIRVCFTVSAEHSTLKITVSDNGIGMDSSKLEVILAPNTSKSNFSGIGVKNVSDRIRLTYGDEYGVSYQSSIGCGTTVTIRLPLLEEEKHESAGSHQHPVCR